MEFPLEDPARAEEANLNARDADITEQYNMRNLYWGTIRRTDTLIENIRGRVNKEDLAAIANELDKETLDAIETARAPHVRRDSHRWNRSKDYVRDMDLARSLDR